MAAVGVHPGDDPEGVPEERGCRRGRRSSSGPRGRGRPRPHQLVERAGAVRPRRPRDELHDVPARVASEGRPGRDRTPSTRARPRREALSRRPGARRRTARARGCCGLSRGRHRRARPHRQHHDGAGPRLRRHRRATRAGGPDHDARLLLDTRGAAAARPPDRTARSEGSPVPRSAYRFPSTRCSQRYAARYGPRRACSL